MSTADRLSTLLPTDSYQLHSSRDALCTLNLNKTQYPSVLRRLREGGFETCTFVTAIDRSPREPRFQLCVQLLSLAHNERVRILVDLPGANPSVASITDLWPGAAYFERECYDMFGVRFEGHANLKRLLMPEEYEHHPLRKDFPHHGIEPDRLYRAWDRARNTTTP